MFFKNACKNVCFFVFFVFCFPSFLCSHDCVTLVENPTLTHQLVESSEIDPDIQMIKSKIRFCKKPVKLSYYLNTADFIASMIEIPTSNVLVDSTTISSDYLAGLAPLYNSFNEKVGVCSASFLCIQNANGIYTDISNYISVDNGLIITWFTPTTLINLELDTIIHSMVTECIVTATTKVGFNPFYGKKFNMIVSSDQQKIYFELTEI